MMSVLTESSQSLYISLLVQCLCVLMNLLHCVSESAGESLMDAANLAIVLSPNIMRPHFDIIRAAQGNPLKNQAGEYYF